MGSLLVHALTGYSGNYHANIFFAVYKFFDKWGWDSLPEQYKCQPHISSDIGSLSTDNQPTCSSDLIQTDTDECSNVELPSKQV